MSLKVYLWMMRMGVLMALIAFVFVAIELDPETSGVLGLVFFYSSLFLFLSGFFTQIFAWIRRRYSDPSRPFQYIGISFRQGLLLSLLAIILLFMQSQQVLVWWDGLLVVLGIFILELYFLIKMSAQN